MNDITPTRSDLLRWEPSASVISGKACTEARVLKEHECVAAGNDVNSSFAPGKDLLEVTPACIDNARTLPIELALSRTVMTEPLQTTRVVISNCIDEGRSSLDRESSD